MEIATVELMEACTGSKWNEVRLVGTTEAGKVEVAGFWIKVDKEGRPLDEKTAQQLQAIASRGGLPFVTIEDKAKKFPLGSGAPEVLTRFTYIGEGEQKKMVEQPRAFAVNRDGLRFVLDFTDSRFIVVNDERMSRDMTPEEFIYAKGIIETEFDPTKREELQDVFADLENKYQEFHKTKAVEG